MYGMHAQTELKHRAPDRSGCRATRPPTSPWHVPFTRQPSYMARRPSPPSRALLARERRPDLAPRHHRSPAQQRTASFEGADRRSPRKHDEVTQATSTDPPSDVAARDARDGAARRDTSVDERSGRPARGQRPSSPAGRPVDGRARCLLHAGGPFRPTTFGRVRRPNGDGAHDRPPTPAARSSPAPLRRRDGDGEPRETTQRDGLIYCQVT